MGSGYVDIESNPILKEWMDEALEKGYQRGLQSTVRVVRRLLAAKFGRLPDWVDARLAGATAEELESWNERALTAPTIEAVFN